MGEMSQRPMRGHQSIGKHDLSTMSVLTPCQVLCGEAPWGEEDFWPQRAYTHRFSQTTLVSWPHVSVWRDLIPGNTFGLISTRGSLLTRDGATNLTNEFEGRDRAALVGSLSLGSALRSASRVTSMWGNPETPRVPTDGMIKSVELWEAAYEAHSLWSHDFMSTFIHRKIKSICLLVLSSEIRK